MNPDREAPLNCPKCGAPATLPESFDGLTVACRFCDETFTVPRSIREAEERRFFRLRSHDTSSSSASTVVAVMIGITMLGASLAAIIAYRTARTPSVVTQVQAPRPAPPAESVPSSPQTSIDESLATGEIRVKEMILNHAAEGCKTVLLGPTRIVGGRDIDAKLVANGPCVRLLASSGTSGDTLDLTMHTPKGKSLGTPAPASELDFLYCAKQAGLHPCTIRSLGDHAFAVASIECQRSTNSQHP